MVMLSAFFCYSSANAQEEAKAKLYIPDFTVDSYNPVTVQIMLDNKIEVTGYSFNIEMPEGLEIVPNSAVKTDRFGDNMQMQMRNGTVGVYSMSNSTFIGNNGCVGTFQVKAKSGSLSVETEKKIILTNVDIVTLNPANSIFTKGPVETTVKMVNPSNVPDLTMSFSPMSTLTNPGGTFKVGLALENNLPLNALQLDITLPEGFNFVKDANTYFTQTPRMRGGAGIIPTVKNNFARLVISDMESNEILTAGSGDFLTFNVSAPADFTAEEATILVNGIVATVNFKTVKVAETSFTITNGKTAYDKAMAEVAGLETELANALQTIATEYPDVKDNFPGTEISTQIDALKTAIEAAYTDMTLTPNYDEVMAPVQTIKDAIAALIAAAKDAQDASDAEKAAEAARQQAYTNANALIADLQKALADAVEAIAKDYPDVKDQFTGENITNDINTLKAAIDAAYEDKTIVENYETLVAPAKTIEAAITQLVADAKAAHDANVAQAALDKALADANAVVANVETAFANALEEIATKCPDVKDQFTGEAISNDIASLKAAITSAYEDKTLVENYETVVAPAKTIEAAIAQLVIDAIAAQKASDDDKAAEAARQKAYADANAVVTDLQNELNAALQTIATDCPDVKDQFKGEAITADIAKMKAAIDAAFENKTIVENYETLVAPAETIKAAIAKLIADAKAAQKVADDEAAAAAALEKARTDANTALAGLDKALADALVEIANTCPDVKHLFTGTAIQQQIAVLRNAVNAAYENKTLATNYEEVMAPAAEIQSAIAKLIADAKAAQKANDDDKAAELARQDAYKNANALIANLQTALQTALQTIATECPDVKDQFKGENVTADIAAMKTAIDSAFENKTIVENYETLVAPAETIKAAIAKLIADAKAAQKVADDEAAAAAALEKARTNANTKLAALDKALADALAEIETSCPDVKHLYTGASIQQKITVLRNAVNAAYENKTLAEKYDEVMAPAADIEKEIAKLIADAKAAQKKADDAEKDRQEYNKKAYESDLDAIQDLEDQLADAKKEMDDKWPDYNYAQSYTKILNAIAALKSKVEAEKNRVAKEGVYSYSVDKLPIENMIENMLIAARATLVDEVVADEVAEGDRIFTLDGKQVPVLQHGKVNIIVKANGTTQKVFVK